MALESWILPILFGLVAAILLLTILFKDNFLRQSFADLGALIQLQTSRPVYYGIGYVPINYNAPVPPSPSQGQITTIDSPLWMDTGIPYPVYNYYPKAPLNPVPTNTHLKIVNNQSVKDNNGLAFANPDNAYNAHKAYYWALSGGYPYPYPMMVMPPTDMDKVRGVEDK
jgi:hypothetical protein